MIWPSKMAVFYPYPGMFPWWLVFGAFVLFVFISFLAIRVVRQRPYFTVGWLWYIGALVPVIGLVQAGGQAMADRYTYVPLIGLFIIIAWGVPDLVARWSHRKIWLATLTTLLLSILMVVTWKQVRYWKSSITLYEHALEETSKNWLAHNNLGIALENQGRVDEAIDHYFEALRIKPGYTDAHNNLGVALEKQGFTNEAIGHYLEALQVKPDHEYAHNNLGNALLKQGRTDEAMAHFLEALRIKPDYVDAHYNLGTALANQGRTDEAIGHFLEALRLEASYVKAHYNLGTALANQGRTDEAIAHYLKALRIKPDYVDAHNNLGVAFYDKGNIQDAIASFEVLGLTASCSGCSFSIWILYRSLWVAVKRKNSLLSEVSEFI